jgi:hypothetical protein
MAKYAKPNWSSFTKAELIKTIRTLSARETKHLNRIAKLEAQGVPQPPLKEPLDLVGAHTGRTPNATTVFADLDSADAGQTFPWETALPNPYGDK